MSRNSLKHQVISASAGSGKTFQLVNRYLQLLINYNVPPEGIVALTFSRKAAAEIFDAIIQRLAQAAISEHKRMELGDQIENGTIDHQQLIELLRTLIHRLHQLRISTYDSFFSWIVKTFPLEFGMSGNFEILMPEQECLTSRRIITQVLNTSAGDRSSYSAFLAAFKQATFGKEEKRLQPLLHEFIASYHEYYLNVPNGSRWGNPEIIWPTGCRWFNPQSELKNLAESLEAVLAKEALNDRQSEKWRLFLEEVTRFSGDALTENLKYLLVKLIAVLDDLHQGQAEITVFKKQFLGKDICAVTSQIVEYIIRCILEAKIQKTGGIYQILHHYEQLYDRLIRRSGTLSFRDIEYVLSLGSQRKNCCALSLDRSAENRLYIEYRLDSRFDHWLLDEFQDTSNRQWQILANLIDEVLQDNSGTRSFFYVGDIKQAIHGWRGGDMDLFNQLHEFYNQDGEHIHRKPLVTSYRSASQIINTVNKVFSLENLKVLPAPVVDRWNKNWCEHTTAREDLKGFVGLVRAPKQGSDRQDIGPCGEALVKIIKTLPYRSTELSVAVLVRSNKIGRTVTNLLRDNHIQCTWEGDTGLIDNPLTSALLSLLKVAQHPGDSFSWQHVLMTPLKDCVNDLNISFSDLVLFINRQLHCHGISFALNYWYRRLQPRIAASEFGKNRMVRLLEVARMFDDKGSRNVVEFIDFLANFSITDVSEAGSIRVMTIHKSKGLGFDIVLLPELRQTGGINSAGKIDLGLQRQQGIKGVANWVFSMPIREIATADPVLSDYVARADNDHCYEELCLLYVAITRAKRALYMIACEQSQGRTTVHYSTLIENALHGQAGAEDTPTSELIYLYQDGDPNWHAQFSNSIKKDLVRQLEPPASGQTRTTTREGPMPHLRPSGIEQRFLSAGQLFSLSNRDTAGTGSAVHSLFEQVEWLDSMDIDHLLKNWNGPDTFPPDIVAIARNEFSSAVEGPNIQKLMQRPQESDVEVWREKCFEMVLDDHFISGSFDRVVLVKNSTHQAETASIIDFKTDRVDPGADLSQHVAIYKPQLNLYCKVLSVMLDLPEAKISCHLVFTKIDRVIDLN